MADKTALAESSQALFCAIADFLGENKSKKVLDIKHRPHKPLSRDIEDEVRDLSDMADVHFTPDFDFDPDKK